MGSGDAESVFTEYSLRAIYKALAILEKNCEMYTRELLWALKSWGYGESLIQALCREGLITRYRKCAKKNSRPAPTCGSTQPLRCKNHNKEDDEETCHHLRIYNRLTEKGAQVLRDLEKYLGEE